jgi:hypothetical protein
LGLQVPVFLPKAGLILDMPRVYGDASHWANLHALRLVKMPHAFRTFVGVNFVNFGAQINRLIWAFRLAHVAVDALVGNHQSHAMTPAKLVQDFILLIIDSCAALAM